jgi:hypothetical protein
MFKPLEAFLAKVIHTFENLMFDDPAHKEHDRGISVIQPRVEQRNITHGYEGQVVTVLFCLTMAK